LIDKEIKYFEKYGPQLFPAIVINNQTFRGQLEIEAVFNAICAGFYTQPHFCKKFLETNQVNSNALILDYAKHKVITHGKVLLMIVVICSALV
jgi:hypothetical protein